MFELQNNLFEDGGDMSQVNPETLHAFSQANKAMGALMMLSYLEPAISDGTRNGSTECAKVLQSIPSLKKQCIGVVEQSLTSFKSIEDKSKKLNE